MPVQVELTNEELVALREALDNVLGDLSSEIADTDNPSYRADLNRHRDVLRQVRARLDNE
jgi:hypothetical protein